jgi:hypothetical protein
MTSWTAGQAREMDRRARAQWHRENDTKNFRDFCIRVENTLGWSHDRSMPRWRALSIEASRLRRKMDTDPALFTWPNLELAVELLRREQREVASPTAVCWHVERALALAAAPEPVLDGIDADIDDLVNEIAQRELADGDPEGWAMRLHRAWGREGRLAALVEYADTRRG